MKIKTKDEIVRQVISKIDQRSITGQQKYGGTMMEEIKGEIKVAPDLFDVWDHIEAPSTVEITERVQEIMKRRAIESANAVKIMQLWNEAIQELKIERKGENKDE